MEQLTSEQVAQWQAYDQLEPIGGYREDFRIGMVCSIIVNLAQAIYGKKGKKQTSSPESFFPWWKDEVKSKPIQSLDEMKTILLSMAKSQKKQVEQTKRKE